MSDDTKKHLFLLGFAERDAADAAVAQLKELQNEKFIEVRDYAVVSKSVGGELTVTEDKDADPGASRGAVAGVMGGALIALMSTPIGLGAVAVGAGVGAVTGALRDSGFKSNDLDEVGRLMRDGRTILIVAVRPEDTDKLRAAMDDAPELVAADARLEAVVPAESKNVLRDAIDQWKQDEARKTMREEG